MQHVSSATTFLARILILIVIKQVNSSCHTHRYMPDDCGLIEEIPGETRTQVPWTVGIFLKDGENNATSFYLHSTGVILGPTTILSVFTGPVEKLARKVRGRGHDGHPPSDFIIVAGLRSGNLSDHDEHTQVAEVSFIQPHLSHEETNRDFHFVLFHLKTTLDFSTPYVKSICLPHFQFGRKIHQNQTKGDFLHGGFAKVKINPRTGNGVDGESEPGWDTGLHTQLVETGLGYECVKMYEKYYEGVFPAGMFCARVPLPQQNSSEEDPLNFEIASSDSGCLMQGSAITHKVGHQYYLAGLTTFIRGRKGGLCRNGTVYFNSRLSIVNEWVEKSVRCSPFSFPCSDGTCIPLESVCNAVPNCHDMSESDENEILCEINHKCGPSSVGGGVAVPRHQCNLGESGGCISKEQICDGLRDCEDGSEESPVLCNRDLNSQGQGSRSSRHISADGSSNNILMQPHCPPLHETDGVQIEYVSTKRNGLPNCSFIPEGTFAILKCKPFYKSTQIQTRLELQCDENGKWSDQIKFQCQPDCGLLNKTPPTFSWNDKHLALHALPWHVLLFNLDSSTQKIKFVCGASIISSKYLITAGHCFEAGRSLKSFKVVVAAVSKNFSENLNHERPFMTEIDNVWRPEELDKTSKEGDVALVKIKRPLTFGAAIRPPCFLDDSNTDSDRESAAAYHNKIQALPNNEFLTRKTTPFAQTGLHISDFPSVSEMVCVENGFGSSSRLQCVGHENGNFVRQNETGGGLVSLSKTKFGSRYVLKGVMSYEEIQDAEPISHFTSLQKYRVWISDIIHRRT